MKQRLTGEEYDAVYTRRYLVWRRGTLRRLKRAMARRARRDVRRTVVPVP